MKTKYVLTCPNAAENKETGVTLTTKFVYDTYEEAIEHKKACESWAKLKGEEDKSYITKKETKN